MSRARRTGPDRAGMDRLRLELRRASGPFLLYVLLVAAGLFTGASIVRNLTGDKPWVDYESYQVAFTDVKGVVPGRAELRLAGVKAGSVKTSKLIDGRAVLTINLESRYAPLYRDARVRIRPVTPLEDMYVDIESRGHPSAGKLGGSDILPARRTISPVQIGPVLDVLDKGTRANVATVLDELGRGTKDGGRNLRWSFAQVAPFLRSAQTLSDVLADRRANLARLIHDLGGITNELAHHDRQLTSFVTSADQTLGELAAHDAPFRATLVELPPTLQVMRQSFANLRETEDALDPALRSLRPVADSLPKGLTSLSRFSVAATPALRALRPAAHNLRPLARSLRPTADSLAGGFEQLRHEAPLIDTATKKTVPCLSEISNLLSRTMSFTKFGDVNSLGGNVGDARADVRVDFSTAGQLFKDPAWKIYPPCNRKDAKR